MKKFFKRLLSLLGRKQAERYVRGQWIQPSLTHDEGAYAQCCYCHRYSDQAAANLSPRYQCDCGRNDGWTGSFKKPTHRSRWSEGRPRHG